MTHTKTLALGDGDLIDLAARLRKLDLETGLDLALALRAAKRPRRSAASRKGWTTRRQSEAA